MLSFIGHLKRIMASYQRHYSPWKGQMRAEIDQAMRRKKHKSQTMVFSMYMRIGIGLGRRNVHMIIVANT